MRTWTCEELDDDKFIGYRIDGETAFHRCAIASPFAHAEQYIVDALNAAERAKDDTRYGRIMRQAMERANAEAPDAQEAASGVD